MPETPILEANVITDLDGNWEFDIPENLSPGAHEVFINDEFGNEESILIFVEQAKPIEQEGVSLVEHYQTDTGMPISPFFLYSILILFVIIQALPPIKDFI